MLDSAVIQCPYCGESYETAVDTSAGSQRYIEDCAVCCRPIDISIRVGGDGELEEIITRSERE